MANTLSKVLGRVEDLKTAESIVKQTSLLYVVLAILMVAMAILVSPFALVDGVLQAGLAGLLFKLRTRWVAGVMLGYSILTLLGTLLVRVGGAVGGSNIFLAVFVVYMSFRAWQATSFLVSSKK